MATYIHGCFILLLPNRQTYVCFSCVVQRFLAIGHLPSAWINANAALVLFTDVLIVKPYMFWVYCKEKYAIIRDELFTDAAVRSVTSYSYCCSTDHANTLN